MAIEAELLKRSMKKKKIKFRCWFSLIWITLQKKIYNEISNKNTCMLILRQQLTTNKI